MPGDLFESLLLTCPLSVEILQGSDRETHSKKHQLPIIEVEAAPIFAWAENS